MRVLILHNYYQQRGGEDTVFESERDLLKQNGHEVEVLCFSNDWIDSPLDRLRAGIANLYNRRAAARLRSRFESFRPDVLHVHNFFPTASPAVFLEASRARVPVVLTLHNFRLFCARATLFREGEICTDCLCSRTGLAGVLHRCYRGSALQSAALVTMTSLHGLFGTWRKKIDHLIALSESSKALLLRSSLGVDEGRVSVKPNFCFDRGVGSTARDGDLLFVGRLVEQKGIGVLLRAFQELEYPLKIIGAGPLEEEVRAAAAQSPNIEYVGFQSPEVVLSELKRAKALVFPSTWYETFGMTIIEAFSTGTPVIASNHGAPAELVEHEGNGLKFRPGDSQDLARSVRRLIDDEPLRAQLGAGARASFLAHYTPERNLELLLDVYRRAIESSVRASGTPA